MSAQQSAPMQGAARDSDLAGWQRLLDEAAALDGHDPLREFRKEFLFPPRLGGKGEPAVYLAGNSLGLQPRKARRYVEEELEDWARLGVDGHLEARHPWLPYHEFLTEQVARLVGAQPGEVVVMNTLTVNLHLMMVSFYRPTNERYKILVEAGAFPSDQYAVASQIKLHGRTPEEALVQVGPREGETAVRDEDLLEAIERHGSSLALVMVGSVNYFTGQAFDLPAIAEAGRRAGARVGFDLAHGAGNLSLSLHDTGPDFAVWCSYKYLNGGPGSLGGCFVHARHAESFDLPRFAGWWGHDKASRFQMPPDFRPLAGAEGWQLSNPPILQLAALRASLELFDRASMEALRKKSEQLTAYLETLLRRLPDGFCRILTPAEPKRRGAQLSLRLRGDGRALLRKLREAGVIADFREPDVMRVAPAPLYCGFQDVATFAAALDRALDDHAPAS